MNEIEYAQRYLGEYKVKGDEIVPKLCPFCHGGEHRDENTFALNKVNHTYNCRRGSCGVQGHFSELCRTVGARMDDSREAIPYKPVRKVYKPSQTAVQAPTDKATAYIQSRKITAETTSLFGVGTDDKGNIVFPYYRTADDFRNRKATFVKFRKPEKIQKGERKMWREADTEPILFGLHLCKPERSVLFICEGEFDAMAIYQASQGALNIVSVPSGAEDFTWLETCENEISQYHTISVIGDSDEPGRKMAAEIAQKLQNKQVKLPDYEKYLGSKDANEILVRHGENAITDVILSMTEIPVNGLLNIAEVRSADLSTMRKTLTGVHTLDRMIGGFLEGDLSVWTGKRGSGKSTFLNQVAIEAVNQGTNVCIYSGEIPADRLKYWITLCAAGFLNVDKDVDKYTGRDVYRVDPGKEFAISSWLNRKMWLYDNKIVETDERSSILTLFATAYSRYDCRVFIVDNLMTVNTGARANDVMQTQADFVIQLRKFAEKYGVHVHVVVHPRKVMGEIKDSDEVGGMGTITNIACNVFTVKRCEDKEKQETGFDSVVTCLKNRSFGDCGTVGLSFDNASRRFSLPGEGQKKYGWENINSQEDNI